MKKIDGFGATPKQIAFLNKLRTQAGEAVAPRGISKAKASEDIDRLLNKIPRRAWHDPKRRVYKSINERIVDGEKQLEAWTRQNGL